MLERIAAVNDNPDLLMSVAEARVFGSYLDVSKEQLNDVDVALRLERRTLPEGMDWGKAITGARPHVGHFPKFIRRTRVWGTGGLANAERSPTAFIPTLY